MKVLRIIGIILLVFVVIILALGLFAPKSYHVNRSLLIDAPKQIVFRHVKYWKNWQAWSPWAEQDSNMQVAIKGTDGKVGSMYQWKGDPGKTGQGEMTNTGVKEDQEIAYHMHFIKPFESRSDGYIKIEKENDATRVTWGFYGKTPFPWNIMTLFMSMDKMVGKDFGRGLALLKNLSEKEATAAAQYTVKKVEFPAKTFAAIRQQVSMKNITDFYTKSFAGIGQAIKKNHSKMVGMPCGIYYQWNEGTGTADMAAAIPIRRAFSSNDTQIIKFAKGPAYSVDYYGPYDQIGQAHTAMDIYFKQNGLQQKAPAIEEYVTDPGNEPDSSKWLTRIYYFTN